MRWPTLTQSPLITVMTLLVGTCGGALAWVVSAPVYILLGPAIAVTLYGLSGQQTGIDPFLRNVCFVLLGITVGAGFNEDALATMLRWPVAFAFMAVVIWAIMVTCRWLLVRSFGFDRRSALLASAPGHLSFAIAIAHETGSDVARISMVQSVRLLALTIVVPFVALAMGIDVSGTITPPGEAMQLWMVPLLIGVSLLVAVLFQRLRVPVPLLLGAMVTSALGHLSGLTPGVLPVWLVLPAYLMLGALIGTRFSGVPLGQFTSGLSAGIAITVVAVVLAGVASVPVAMALGMPLAHVLVAFAPGGFETMIAMGVVLGVVPGFVAACHIARLLVLSVLMPAMLGKGNT